MKQNIIKSLLDDDLYKLTMGQVAFLKFRGKIAKYRFINRAGTEFPVGFDSAMKTEVLELGKLQFDSEELGWISRLPGIRSEYVGWLANFKMDPSQVKIDQDGGKLSVEVEGEWCSAIFWEVKLMAIISELYFRMTGQHKCQNWTEIVEEKTDRLNGCIWADFGTRRRYSAAVQEAVIQTMKGVPGFIGTSNMLLAMQYNLKPIGTYAHESVMVAETLSGSAKANSAWMDIWTEVYGGLYSVALTDTFTTDAFLSEFDFARASKFQGVRHDSGDPVEWAGGILSHYAALGIDAKTKTLVFSDGLTPEKLVELTNLFGHRAIVVGGIGTNLTNDVGVKPLNMVIKMVEFNGVGTVKLSDDKGKRSGNPKDLDRVIKGL